MSRSTLVALHFAALGEPLSPKAVTSDLSVCPIRSALAFEGGPNELE